MNNFLTLTETDKKKFQIIESSNHFLFCADCFDVFHLIPNKSINSVIVDLPYGTTACKWDIIIPFEPLWEQYERIIKNDGCLVFTGTQPFTSQLIMSNLKMFKYELIWDKVIPTGFAISKYQPMKQHENILIFAKGKTTYNPQKIKRDKPRLYNRTHKSYSGSENLNRHDGKNRVLEYYEPRSIQSFSNANRKSKKHPTEKPIELMEWLVKTYTNENDIILDNTMGSGTTGLACLQTNRKFIGIEKEEKYFNIATERLKQYRKKYPLF